MWTTVSTAIAVSATIDRGDRGSASSGMVSTGGVSAAAGMKRADVVGERHRARGDRAGETGDERGPAGQKRGERAESLAQVDVFAAGTRAQRRQLRVGHRAGERERAADQPHADHRRRLRHELRDDDRHEEDAAADDVGDDDGGRVERTEPAFELGTSARRSRCSGWANVAWTFIGSSNCRGMSNGADLHPLRRAVLGEDVDANVTELAVLQHVGAGLRRIAGVAGLGLDGQRRGLVAVEGHALHEDSRPSLLRCTRQRAPGGGRCLKTTLSDSGRRLSSVDFLSLKVMLGTSLFRPSTMPASN